MTENNTFEIIGKALGLLGISTAVIVYSLGSQPQKTQFGNYRKPLGLLGFPTPNVLNRNVAR